MGVFARWVAGVWCLRAGRVRLLVFALLVLARLLGVVGQCGPAAPFAPACLLACSRSGVGLLACAMLPWVRGNGNGAGQRCPAPLRALVALPGCCVRAEGEKGWG